MNLEQRYQDLGKTVRSKVYGYEGRILGLCLHLNGMMQYMVSTEVSQDAFQLYAIDMDEVEILDHSLPVGVDLLPFKDIGIEPWDTVRSKLVNLEGTVVEIYYSISGMITLSVAFERGIKYKDYFGHVDEFELVKKSKEVIKKETGSFNPVPKIARF